MGAGGLDESLVTRYPDLEKSHFWWETRRTLVRRLIAELPVDAPTVLDVGCGSGVTAQLLADAGARVLGIDIEPRDDLRDSDGVRFQYGDFLSLSPRAGQFDVVIALDAVEHFEQEHEMLQAMHANTRPGGLSIVTVPAYDWLWSSHDDENRHFRRYNRSRLHAALERAGFTVERVGYIFAALVLPKALIAFVERLATRSVDATSTVSSRLNKVGAAYFRAETAVALQMRNFLPFGTSVIAVARRPEAEFDGREELAR
jgi:2-polyprenyl-3-methyl-5-hydroxy-6-metoxy-1,4-benzoquinol methylase